MIWRQQRRRRQQRRFSTAVAAEHWQLCWLLLLLLVFVGGTEQSKVETATPPFIFGRLANSDTSELDQLRKARASAADSPLWRMYKQLSLTNNFQLPHGADALTEFYLTGVGSRTRVPDGRYELAFSLAGLNRLVVNGTGRLVKAELQLTVLQSSVGQPFRSYVSRPVRNHSVLQDSQLWNSSRPSLRVVHELTELVARWRQLDRSNGLVLFDLSPSTVVRLSRARPPSLLVYTAGVSNKRTTGTKSNCGRGPKAATRRVKRAARATARRGGRRRRLRGLQQWLRRRRSRCRLRELRVEFGALGWSDWIIAPRSYNAGYCAGECRGPLERAVNATNHAVVQSLMALFDPGRTPPASCVPTEFQPLTLFYVDENRNVVLRNYEQMTAVACGCR